MRTPGTSGAAHSGTWARHLVSLRASGNRPQQAPDPGGARDTSLRVIQSPAWPSPAGTSRHRIS